MLPLKEYRRGEFGAYGGAAGCLKQHCMLRSNVSLWTAALSAYACLWPKVHCVFRNRVPSIIPRYPNGRETFVGRERLSVQATFP